MNQKNENNFLKRSSMRYELIVRNNQTSQENGAPHLILRRKLRDEDQKTTMDVPTPADNDKTFEKITFDPVTPEATSSEIATAQNVSDYISSLNLHVPDDVIRVVDAIIEEEGRMPTNLPKLDDQLTMIYPGSDVQDLPGDDLFFEVKQKSTVEIKAANYTNRVEYEDL